MLLIPLGIMSSIRRTTQAAQQRIQKVPRHGNAAVGSTAAIGAGLSGGVASSLWPGLQGPAGLIGVIRLFFGSLIYISIQLVRGRKPWIRRNEAPYVICSGVLFAIVIITLAAAAHRTLMVTVLIIGAAGPALTAVAERFLFKRQLSALGWTCVLATCLSAAIAVVGAHSGGTERVGNLFAVISETTAITYTLVTSRAVKIMPIDRYLGGVSVVGFLCLSPWLFVTRLDAYSAKDVGLVFCITIFGGVGSWGLFLFAQRQIHTGPISAFGLIGTPVGTFLAWVFFNQTPRAAQIVSGFLVILAVSALLYVQTQEEKKVGPLDQDMTPPEPIAS